MLCSGRYSGLGFVGCSKEQKESLPVYGVCLCVCNQAAYMDNSADVVDELLIIYVKGCSFTGRTRILLRRQWGIRIFSACQGMKVQKTESNWLVQHVFC